MEDDDTYVKAKDASISDTAEEEQQLAPDNSACNKTQDSTVALDESSPKSRANDAFEDESEASRPRAVKKRKTKTRVATWDDGADAEGSNEGDPAPTSD